MSSPRKSLKRKFTMKTVRFASEVTVLETYSADEYDRSDIFSTPVLYKLNPTIKPPQLTLEILPHLVKDEDMMSSPENSPNTPPILSMTDHYFGQKKRKKLQRPKLTIDTNICSDPLFFTCLSTNYKNDTSSTDDFLVPTIL
ncbi:uncharacterized protein B0P05DRAFT_554823 [Gilbertella persicaria]|uniref:uncharacterized protein n=1 Tax=Gilbertella persicaria TaxID=101096 RepID=UPI00221F7C71|nr:uncharacterized protein B0P05DRAFT_554823 [Gilbertella persicaria]KAI8064279.1 hypothetical protein B0P05DRAFT_554823 [Gilbertella persicaria]